MWLLYLQLEFIFIRFLDPENILLDTISVLLCASEVKISENIEDRSGGHFAFFSILVSILSPCHSYNFNFILIGFIDPEYIVLDTKIVLLCALEVKILGK
jgi:hypothetical protein